MFTVTIWQDKLNELMQCMNLHHPIDYRRPTNEIQFYVTMEQGKNLSDLYECACFFMATAVARILLIA
ncbi:MAG: hypothetical protein ACTS7E_00940 [Arsenophonus sp. NC-CH8-MAG3]